MSRRALRVDLRGRRLPAGPGSDLARAAPTPDRSRYILGCYSDVLGDLGRYAARTFLVSGLGQALSGVAVAVSRQLLLYLAEPEAFVSLLDSAAPTPGASQRGLDGFSATAARSLPSFRRMAVRQLEELRRLAAAAEGRDVTVEEVKAEIRALVRDDEYWERLAELVDLDAEELVAALEKVLEDESGGPVRLTDTVVPLPSVTMARTWLTERG